MEEKMLICRSEFKLADTAGKPSDATRMPNGGEQQALLRFLLTLSCSARVVMPYLY
jgi:hypothetical protein